MPRASHQRVSVALLVAVLVAGCGSHDASPSLSSTAPPLPSASIREANPSPTVTLTPLPSATPAPSPSETLASADPFVGQVVVTVSDGLRVRSEPRVSDDSIKYEPLVPLGTELTVIDGPVSASGYTWYKVVPVSFTLRDGSDFGWVAMAAKDGQPWIALSKSPLAGIELAQSDVARASADPAAARTAATSINALGLDLLRAMLADGTLKPDGNAVFSPTSIALALAMARAGAEGETARQMDAVLHTSGWDKLGPGLNALDQVLASRNATWKEWDQGPTYELALQIANAAFAQRGWQLEPTYLQRIAAAFGAGVRLVDFAADYEVARKLINAWVSNQTANRIPDLLDPGNVNPSTRLLLVNAVYLKAVWEAHFFEGSPTAPAAFTRLDGSQVKVPTMQGQSLGLGAVVPFARGTGWQATELRYTGAAGTTPLAMTLVLPDDLSGFESQLSASQLGRITGALDSERQRLNSGAGSCPDKEHNYAYRVVVEMPRFGIETKVDLIPALRTLGISDAFDGSRADFTGTSAQRPLYIGLVVHQANIDVDEYGTEAAAATGIGNTGGPGASACRDITLRLNKPFMFFLRDLETGAVLFMGRVVDPSVGR